jgi:hypothetical protein
MIGAHQRAGGSRAMPAVPSNDQILPDGQIITPGIIALWAYTLASLGVGVPVDADVDKRLAESLAESLWRGSWRLEYQYERGLSDDERPDLGGEG